MKKAEFQEGAIGYLSSGKFAGLGSQGERCTLVRLSKSSAQHVWVDGAVRGMQRVAMNRVELSEVFN